jgi:hypothetical protein
MGLYETPTGTPLRRDESRFFSLHFRSSAALASSMRLSGARSRDLQR